MGAKAGSKGSVKGKSKGSSSKVSAAPVQKPWLKQSAAPVSKGSSKGSAKGGKSSSWSAPIAPWTKVQSSGGKSSSKGKSNGTGASFSSKGSSKGFSKGKGKDKGKDKGKGKGKGKGKFKSAAPKKSQFWVRKMEEENRSIVEGELLTGVCDMYNWKQGWGFIMPDDPDSLPEEAKEKLQEGVEATKSEGKEPRDPNLVYFRKPDVESNFRIQKGSEVTFQLYIDDKGCGACEVCDATGGDEGEEEADE